MSELLGAQGMTNDEVSSEIKAAKLPQDLSRLYLKISVGYSDTLQTKETLDLLNKLASVALSGKINNTVYTDFAEQCAETIFRIKTKDSGTS